MLAPWTIWKRYKNVRDHWDDVCHQCGLCCYMRFVDEQGNVVVEKDQPCPYLDEQTKLCRIYGTRFQEFEFCHKLTLRQAVFAKHLPDTCAYVQLFQNR